MERRDANAASAVSSTAAGGTAKASTAVESAAVKSAALKGAAAGSPAGWGRAGGSVRGGVRLVAALAAAGLALTGCSAGQNAATGETQTAISGVNADAGQLALRDLQVEFGESGTYPEGGQAPLRLWIDNRGAEPVVLESVTSPIAEAVTLATELLVAEESPEEESPVEGESPGDDEDRDGSPTSDDESATPGAGETEADSAAATDSDPEAPDADDATESPAGEDIEVVAELIGESEFAIEIAPSSYVRLTPSQGSFLLLEGLREPVTMDSTVELTFLFSNGEEVTVAVPVGMPEEAPSRAYFGDPHDESDG